MIFLLGIYAVFMMVMLPGAILLRAINLRREDLLSLSLFLPLCFGLSLLFNYFLVLILVLLHVYVPAVIRGIGVIEGLLVILLYWKAFPRVDLVKKWNWTPGLLFAVAWVLLLGFILYWVLNWGNVFGLWDPTVSYNRWAVDWAQNSLPTLTWHYPQLLPTNWSLVYVMMGPLSGGVQLEAFPSGIQGFFFIGMLLFLLDAFYQKKDPAFLLGLILLSIFIPAFFWLYLLTGYADIPVSFFNFGAIMLLLRRKGSSALLFALAAALTKPAGIYTALVIPLLQYGMLEQKSWRSLSFKYIGLLILILPWYFYASVHETNHTGMADILFLAHNLLAGGGFLTGFSVFFYYGSIPFLLLVFLFLFKENLNTDFRRILYAYTPYFFIWLLAFSYDPRNLTLLWPLLCLLTANICYHQPFILDLVKRFRERILKNFPLCLIPFIVVVGVLILSFQKPFQEPLLTQHQLNQKNNSYDRNVMMRLEAYATCPQFKGKILTNYAYFEYIPLLSSYILPFTDQDYGSNMEPNMFKDANTLVSFLSMHPEVRYLLLNRKHPLELEFPRFDEQLQEWQQTGRISLVWGVDGVELYTVK